MCCPVPRAKMNSFFFSHRRSDSAGSIFSPRYSMTGMPEAISVRANPPMPWIGEGWKRRAESGEGRGEEAAWSVEPGAGAPYCFGVESVKFVGALGMARVRMNLMSDAYHELL